jgi:hypothetical protein
VGILTGEKKNAETCMGLVDCCIVYGVVKYGFPGSRDNIIEEQRKDEFCWKILTYLNEGTVMSQNRSETERDMQK